MDEQKVLQLVNLLQSLSESNNQAQSTNIAQAIIRESANFPREYAAALLRFNNQQQGGRKVHKRRSSKRKTTNKRKTHKKH